MSQGFSPASLNLVRLVLLLAPVALFAPLWQPLPRPLLASQTQLQTLGLRIDLPGLLEANLHPVTDGLAVHVVDMSSSFERNTTLVAAYLFVHAYTYMIGLRARVLTRLFAFWAVQPRCLGSWCCFRVRHLPASI